MDTQQLLESWYDKSTFAIATWRGDAQRYWLTQVLDCARAKHDVWLQSTPSQRAASLESAYILADRKHNPQAQNAVESVLRTDLLDAIPKSIADACMRHGYCTAELIVRYVMKQLILPPDIKEVATQKEILTPPKVPRSTLDQGCAWLEEMQHRLNLCIKTRQNVHPRTVVAFVNDTLSGITQYYRTVGNIWDSLSGKHQLRDSNVTLDRIYAMLAEFLIELRMHEEQDKIAQIVTGSSSTVKHSMCDEYINASKGKVPAKVKVSRMMAKVASPNGVHLVMILGSQEGAPRVTIVLVIIQGSSRADVQSAARLATLPHNVHVQISPKPRMLNGKSPHGPMRMKSGIVLNGSLKSMKRQRARKGKKEKDPSLKGSPRARARRDLLLRGLRSLHRQRAADPKPIPNLKHAPA